MNYFKLTNDELHSQLDLIDRELHDFSLNHPNGALTCEEQAQLNYLLDMRNELISFFKEYVGYNPDNLCVQSTN